MVWCTKGDECLERIQYVVSISTKYFYMEKQAIFNKQLTSANESHWNAIQRCPCDTCMLAIDPATQCSFRITLLRWEWQALPNTVEILQPIYRYGDIANQHVFKKVEVLTSTYANSPQWQHAHFFHFHRELVMQRAKGQLTIHNSALNITFSSV